MVAKTVTDVILGEAVHGTREQRYADMVAIASVIQNRATLAGMTPQAIVSVKSEFNAYGKSLPKGADAYRDLAEAAWNQVQTTGPVHNATYYATSSAKDNLPNGLTPVTKTAGHEFFADPKGRSFRTSEGFVTPASATHAAMMSGNLVAPQNPYAGLVPPAPIQTVSLPDIGPIPAMRPDMPSRSITPGAGLANLAPPTPSRPGGINYGAVSYAHPERGHWSTGLTPQAISSIQTLAASNPRGVAITSAYRSPSHPVEARKAAPGQHARGTAYDIDLSGMTEAEKAKTVEYAIMSGASRLGAYSKSNMMHVDFAPATPNRGGVYAMMDRTARNMDKAPGWFTKGLEQVSVPAPTERPSTPLSAPVGPVERASLPAPASPAMGARAASGLQAPPVSPAMGARAASELQGVVPGTPPAPSVLAAAPVNPGTMKASVPSAPVPSALGSIMAPPTSMTPPTMNAAVAPRSVQATDVPLSSIGTFPDAPKSPGRQAAGAIAKGALAGLVTGGLPGAIIGGLVGPARAQISRNVAHNRQNPTNRINPLSNLLGGYRGLGLPSLGGLGGLFSGIPAPNYGAPQYGIGSGYSAIGGAFGAPAGATAYSNSNPNISFTSLGNGYVSRSNAEYGTTSILGPGDYDPGTSSGKSGKGK